MRKNPLAEMIRGLTRPEFAAFADPLHPDRVLVARRGGTPWRCMNWLLWEVPDDRPGAGAAVLGEPGPEAGRRGPGQHTLDTAASKQLTYPEMLEQLLGTEVEARRERCLSTWTKMAGFVCL